MVPGLPVAYLAVALLLSWTSVPARTDMGYPNKVVYLNPNGVHLDIVIPKSNLAPALIEGLSYAGADQYFGFGWGDEQFYLNTPHWRDLTLKTAFKALMVNSPTLVHLTRHHHKGRDWVAVPLSEQSLDLLNRYIAGAFAAGADGQKVLLPNRGYGARDDFYKATGSYTCFNTCNTWANRAFIKSGLRACRWTPFEFGLIGKYR